MSDFLTWADAHPLITWMLVSLVLNLLIAERSRVDVWCVQHPRVAAALKFLRAIGIDPWHVVASASLAVRKRLPELPVQGLGLNVATRKPTNVVDLTSRRPDTAWGASRPPPPQGAA